MLKSQHISASEVPGQVFKEISLLRLKIPWNYTIQHYLRQPPPTVAKEIMKEPIYTNKSATHVMSLDG